MADKKMKVTDERKWPFTMVDNHILDDETNFSSTYEKMIYVILSRYANNKSKQAWPSVTTIAKKVKCGEKTVRRVLQRLEELRLIEVDRSNGRHNVYRILDVPESFKTPVTQTAVRDTAVTLTAPPRSHRPDTPVTQTAELDKRTRENRTIKQQQQQGSTGYNPFTAYQRYFGRFPTPIITDEIKQWIETDGIEKKAIVYALYKASENGHGFGYTKGIIRNWLQKGITTYEQAENEFKGEDDFGKVSKHRRSHGRRTSEIEEFPTPEPRIGDDLDTDGLQ